MTVLGFFDVKVEMGDLEDDSWFSVFCTLILSVAILAQDTLAQGWCVVSLIADERAV